MRTTLNLPDALVEQAKAAAAREGRTLTSSIEAGLRAVLRQHGVARPVLLPAYGSGQGAVLVDLDDREAVAAALDARPRIRPVPPAVLVLPDVGLAGAVVRAHDRQQPAPAPRRSSEPGEPAVAHVLHPHRLHAPAADLVWAAATLVLAGLGLVLALAEQYDPGALVAAAAVAAGGWSMLISKTLTERFETVVGTVLGAALLAVCLAYGSGLSV